MADTIQVEGRIISVLPGTMFRVELGTNKHLVLAHISGKMRKNFVRLTIGDKVIIEMSSHDLQKGRILRRIDPPRPGMPGRPGMPNRPGQSTETPSTPPAPGSDTVGT